jgi:hypothetical protein
MRKCKECDCCWSYPIADYSKRKEHRCHYAIMCGSFGSKTPIMNITQTGAIGSDGQLIKGKDYQTSPTWCPLRTKQ